MRLTWILGAVAAISTAGSVGLAHPTANAGGEKEIRAVDDIAVAPLMSRQCGCDCVRYATVLLKGQVTQKRQMT